MKKFFLVIFLISALLGIGVSIKLLIGAKEFLGVFFGGIFLMLIFCLTLKNYRKIIEKEELFSIATSFSVIFSLIYSGVFLYLLYLEKINIESLSIKTIEFFCINFLMFFSILSLAGTIVGIINEKIEAKTPKST